MNTWIIEPNWLAWTLLCLATISLVAIALRLWRTSNRGTAINHFRLSGGELYKTIILTAWLAFSGLLMWNVYNTSMAISDTEFWSKQIAIIGIIVATLIGWQIYSAMDWNSKAERLSKIEDNYKSIVDEVANNRNFTEASVIYLDADSRIDDAYNNPDENKHEFEEIYKSLLLAISLYTAPSVEKSIQNCIDRMYGMVDAMRRHQAGKDDDFHEFCDKLYLQIKANKEHLTLKQQDALKTLNTKRKALKYDLTEDDTE